MKLKIMNAKAKFSIVNNQKGISAIIIAVCLVMLIGFIALSIDVSHLVVARNELQNAADAGALAAPLNYTLMMANLLTQTQIKQVLTLPLPILVSNFR